MLQCTTHTLYISEIRLTKLLITFLIEVEYITDEEKTRARYVEWFYRYPFLSFPNHRSLLANLYTCLWRSFIDTFVRHNVKEMNETSCVVKLVYTSVLYPYQDILCVFLLVIDKNLLLSLLRRYTKGVLKSEKEIDLVIRT